MEAVVDPEALVCVGFVLPNTTLYNEWANCVCVSVTYDMVGKPLQVQREGDSYVLSLDDSAVVAQAWTALRTERNARLAASDWTQLQDTHLSAEKKSAWADYRQALRDLPDELTDPTRVDWPLDPTAVVQAPVSGSRLTGILGQV